LPFSVLLGTPIAVFGAFGALYLLKLVAPQASENDVFTQIGLVMLIGLAAKNAILIVEFAKVEYEKGMTLLDATLAGAKVRLRPILMTAFAFILGVVPLVLATGAGAHGRVLLGLAVFGGMLASTVIAIFLIPVSFYVVENLTHRGGPQKNPIPGAPAPGMPNGSVDGHPPQPVQPVPVTPIHGRESGSYGGGD
jgi:HAE1 family hydrophobic/amphiphilic exporter-1